MRLHLVFNPVAGRAGAPALVADIVAHLTRAGHAVTTYDTKGPGDGARHLRGLPRDHCDRLVAVGGDGTLREVVGALGEDPPWPIGIVPRGTANLVARELGMPLDATALRYAEALADAQPWRVGVMDVHQQDAQAVAVANVSVGTDARVVHAIDEVRAHARGGASGGYLQWLAPAARALGGGRHAPLSVTVDGQRTWRAWGCVVQGAANYGGFFRLAPDAAMDAARMRVCIVRSRTTRDLVRLLALALVGRAHRARDLTVVPAARVQITSRSAVPVQADGDAHGRTDVRITHRPDALTLLRVPTPAGTQG